MTTEPRQPLVSVVVPVYNHARYVGKCLDSVFDQTHRPLQLIVIDDGSKDGSPGVVEEYLARRGETPGVQVFFRARENRGAHINRPGRACLRSSRLRFHTASVANGRKGQTGATSTSGSPACSPPQAR